MAKSTPRFWAFFGVLALLLAASAAGAAVGPSRVAAQDGKTKLVFWNYWDGKNGEVIQSLVDRYNQEHPDVEIENVFIGFNDLLPKLQAAAAGGDAPDVAAGDLIWMPKLARSGALAPLDEDAAEAGIQLDDFYPALLNVGRYDGKLFSLPVSTNNLQLFYNKELFQQAGLDPNAPPTTWDELRTMARQCTNADEGVYGMELFTEPGEGLTWQFQVYLWQAGGEFLTEDLSQAAFNSPAGERALQFWIDLLQADRSAPLAPWGQFGQGKACMVMDGSWMVGIWSAEPPFDFGTAAMPTPSGGEPATNMGGEQIFLFEQEAARRRAAFDFVAWLTSSEIQLEWSRQTGFMPIRASVATDPSYLSYVRETEPRLLPFVENQQYARNRPPVANYPEISDAFSRELEAALLGQVDAKEALAAAERAVNAFLES